MAKSDAKKLMGKMAAPGAADFGSDSAVVIDRREQRKRDQALGLIPFAVKLNSDLVQQLQALAKERGLDLNEVTAEVLMKGLKA
ncbi:Conserved hypothetical protein [Herminiimonas arsenicoxydans]|uniref:LexA regulated protein n=1 Tax=Herminiimonas arsenicoxydans TaxID=204773 RepID=A4G373_HERAR|nr:Conserved hypothetical protein [Herminiimonas arsenicoxydans]